MGHPSSEPRGSAREREIVAARAIVGSPGRRFLTLELEARSGIFGLGDATLNGREPAVAGSPGRRRPSSGRADRRQ
jgi:mannonate dehydratase